MTGALTPDGWSAYDDSVPHTTGLPHVVERAAALRGRREPPAGASLADVARVVVVVSSSRGGSSLFAELLRRVEGLVHLRGEMNPLVTLAGLHRGPERRRVLEEELLRDIGTPAPPGPLDAADRERLVLDLAWRLTVQWPQQAAALSLDELLAVIGEVVPAAGRAYDAVPVHLQLVRDLRRREIPVHPGYYDLPPGVLDRSGPGVRPPAGPPGDSVVEMAPFVTVGRWRPASPEQLRSHPLVLCTPRSSFRLAFIRDLFPRADLRVVHLTRNPAASVNGLIDGWRHHGFSNCRVEDGLDIDGYTGEVPGGDEWWCYDFPPGWERYTSSPLPEVCAFQWQATHEAALVSCEQLGIDPHRIRFEDVVGSPAARLRVAATLEPVLGVDRGSLAAVLAGDLPVVMATASPAPGRWRRREAALDAVLAEPALRAVAARLGYDDPSDWH